MTGYKKLVLIFVAQIVFAMTCIPSFAAEDPLRSGPSVLKLHSTLLSNMQGSLDFPGRYQRLQPTVNEIFDSSAIARVSLGATWRKLLPVERKQFVQLMVDTIAATYADRFVDYTGQQFEVLSELENRPGRWVVKTVLTKADGGKVNLDYYIKDGRIFNVIADGVSDLSLRRADYAGVIKQNGYVFLLESLKNKLAAFGK